MIFFKVKTKLFAQKVNFVCSVLLCDSPHHIKSLWKFKRFFAEMDNGKMKKNYLVCILKIIILKSFKLGQNVKFQNSKNPKIALIKDHFQRPLTLKLWSYHFLKKKLPLAETTYGIFRNWNNSTTTYLISNYPSVRLNLTLTNL